MTVEGLRDILENAHVALNQTEYQNRYNALVECFDKAKARLEAVNAICATNATSKRQSSPSSMSLNDWIL